MVCFLVLINGSPSRFFNSSHGLRQEDPLSPLLFVVVIEALSRLLSTLVDKGLLSGFSVGLRPISCLQRIMLIFCEAKLDHVCHICCLFLCFEVVL